MFTYAGEGLCKVIQLVLGESSHYVQAAVAAAMFTCGTASAQTSHVHLEPRSAYAQTIEAARDNKKISLQFRSVLVRTDFPGAQSGQYAVEMIYDPKSKLFGWRSLPIYQGYDVKLAAKQFAKNSFVYLVRDRLVVFSRLTLLSLAVVWESTEHYASLDQGQHSVQRVLERRATAETEGKARFKTLDLTKEIPRNFMEQCYNAMSIPPEINEVRRNGEQWIFNITGPNGNSAEVSADDSYQVVATKLIPRPAVIVEKNASPPTPVHAMRNGISSRLEARELLLNIAHGCDMAALRHVLMVYDPATKLFLWFPEGAEADFLPMNHPFPDDIATHFFKNSIFVVTES